MSAPLVVSIPHRLGREEATRRLKAGLGRASSSVPTLIMIMPSMMSAQCVTDVPHSGQKARCVGLPESPTEAKILALIAIFVEIG